MNEQTDKGREKGEYNGAKQIMQIIAIFAPKL